MSYQHRASDIEGALFRYTARKRGMLAITQAHEVGKDRNTSLRGRLYRCWARGVDL